MSCYIVPLVQAAATSICRKAGWKTGFLGRNLASLEMMLWGGSVMLIVDHAVNGELFAWTIVTVLVAFMCEKLVALLLSLPLAAGRRR